MDEKLDVALRQLEEVNKEVEGLRMERELLKKRIGDLEMEITRCHNFVLQVAKPDSGH